MIDEYLLLSTKEHPSPERLAQMNPETAHEWDRREVFGWPPRRRTYTVTYDSYTPPEPDEDGEPRESEEGEEDHGFVSRNDIEWSLYPPEHAPDFTGPAYDDYLAEARALATEDIEDSPDDVSIDNDTYSSQRACSREAVRRMVEVLRNVGATETNGCGDVYSSPDADTNFRTGVSTRTYYHLDGWSRMELDAIANAIG